MTERSYFYYNTLDSTMLEYQRLQEACLNKALICVRAGSQARGVGRLEKAWLSPPGGLWFTFNLRISQVLNSFPLYVGYCMHECLSRVFSPLADKLQIKWTNDIIYEGRKLGGTLCQHRPGLYTIGIGINTNNEIDADLGKFGAVSLKSILGFEVSNSYLCQLLVTSIEEHVRQLQHEISYITYCNENLFGKNRMAEIDLGTEPFKAEILGLDLHGALIIRKSMGEIVNLHSGSIMKVF